MAAELVSLGAAVFLNGQAVLRSSTFTSFSASQSVLQATTTGFVTLCFRFGCLCRLAHASRVLFRAWSPGAHRLRHNRPLASSRLCA